MVASGGFGASKTFGCALKALFLSDIFPNNRGVIARKVWDDLKKTTMTTVFKILPAEAYAYGRRSDQDKVLRLNNGSEIIWMHLDDVETEKLIRGLEINWFFIDQAEEVDEAIFDMLMSRLGRWDRAQVPERVLALQKAKGRPWAHHDTNGRPIPPTYAMLTCNPDTETHWIYRRFHPDSAEKYEPRIPVDGVLKSYHDLGYTMYHMSSLDNKFLPKQNKAELLAKDKSFVDRFVLGKWGITEGQIHFISPESIIPGHPDLLEWVYRHCVLHRVLDHGDSAPTCVLWFGTDQAGNVFVYREYYRPNALISVHRENIFQLSKNERYTFQLADPDIFTPHAQKNQRRWSVADEYSDCTEHRRETAIHWQAADNNELGTRNRISEYLYVDKDRVNPFTKQKGSPRLFFLSQCDEYQFGCNRAIVELRSQKREHIGTELGRPIFSDVRNPNVPDHAYDCIRYFIASRPPVNRAVDQRMHEMSFFAVRKRYLAFKRAGGYNVLAKRARREAV